MKTIALIIALFVMGTSAASAEKFGSKLWWETHVTAGQGADGGR